MQAIGGVLGRVHELSTAERATERALVAGLSMDRIVADTTALSRAPRPHGSTGYAAGVEHAVTQAQDVGWTVRRESSWVGPWRSTNVVLERRGTAPDGERGLVVGGAHLDTVRGTPGANDNGAAVATVLETARALANTPTTHDIKLVLFDREEQGLVGARSWIGKHRTDLGHAIAMLNVEMPAAEHQTKAAFSVGQRTDGSVPAVIERVAARNGIDVHPWDERTMRSDNRAFDNAGVPNAMFGVRFGPDMASTAAFDPHYHGHGDTVDRLNLDVLRGHAELFTLTLHDLANGPAVAPRVISNGARRDPELRAMPYLRPAPAAIGIGLLGAGYTGLRLTRDER